MRITEAAWDELLGAAAHYEGRSAGVGYQFLLDFDRLIDQIETFPDAGLLVQPGLRQRLVPNFPYLVFYTTDAAGPEVIAVAHTSRRAQSWTERWEVRETAAAYLQLAA